MLSGWSCIDDTAVREIAIRSQSECHMLNLVDMDIHFCTGCWSCWWKTPGLCIFRDDMDVILEKIITSDLLLLATPTLLGLPSALIKKTLDRSIPLVHPYIIVSDGELHHRKRYIHYPNLALNTESGGNPTNFDNISTWIHRYARNFHGQVLFTYDESVSSKEVADALDRV